MDDDRETNDEADSQLPDLSQFRVLVVDDNEDMREIVRSMLHRLRVAQIEEAESGDAALLILRDFRCDMVIVAMTLRHTDGIELVRQIRDGSDDANATVPIIMTSPATSVETVLQARDAGIDEFVATPFSFNVLCEHIVGVTRNPRPVIKTSAFTGPDRRRRNRNVDGMERRRKEAKKTERKLGMNADPRPKPGG